MFPSAFQELLNKAAAAKQANSFSPFTSKPAVNTANLPQQFQAFFNQAKQAAAPAPTPTPVATPAPVEKAPAKSMEQEEYEKAVTKAKEDYIEAMATKSPTASTSKSVYEKTVEYTPEKKAAEAKQKQIEEQQAIAAKQKAEKMAEIQKFFKDTMEKQKAQKAKQVSFLTQKNKPALLQMKLFLEKLGMPVSPELQAAIDEPPAVNPYEQSLAFKKSLEFKNFLNYQ